MEITFRLNILQCLWDQDRKILADINNGHFH